MKTISIDDLVFLNTDTVISTERVEEYYQRYMQGDQIEPLTVFHVRKGFFLARKDTYYAPAGRHRAYMFFNRLREIEIPVEIEEGHPLNKKDPYHLGHSGITVRDLVEEPW
jgi:hypothetical protein